jgi:hypothetical protein
MNEKTPRLKVVGGIDHNPDKRDDMLHIEPLHEVTPQELLDLWVERVHHMPVDFAQSRKAELVATYTATVKDWTVSQLYTYLHRKDIWTRPSLTYVVMEEVVNRKNKGDFSPL